MVVDVLTETSFGLRQLGVSLNPVSSPRGGADLSARSSLNHDSWWLYRQWGAGEGSPWLLNSSDYNQRAGGSSSSRSSSRSSSGTSHATSGSSATNSGVDPRLPDPRLWQLSVNGRRIFLRGGNWVPADQMLGRAVRQHARVRALLQLARDAGYTFLRVWAGGVLEDSSFYALCDEFGILIEQEVPGAAGCAYTQPDWLNSSAIEQSWREQLPAVLAQLVNHPSIARYSMANEFYLNTSYSPIVAAYQQVAHTVDPTRMARMSDPVCVGQRHGPYTFAAIGRRAASSVGSYEVFGLGCGNFEQPNCSLPLGSGGGGPGDPFEWTEFGAPALSDVETLESIMPRAALLPSGRLAPEWGWHKADGNPFISWQAAEFYRELFLDSVPSSDSPDSSAAPDSPDSSAASFRSLSEEVRASQWVQAEGLRYAFQAARRSKPHRSAMASWTLNEPWPNAAHQSLIDYRGRPKHAYWWVAQALATADVSLEYYSLLAVADGRTPLKATVWVDLEAEQEGGCGTRYAAVDTSDASASDASASASATSASAAAYASASDASAARCRARVELFFSDGNAAAPEESFPLPNQAIQTERATRLGSISYAPPASAAGRVLLLRLSLLRADEKSDDRGQKNGGAAGWDSQEGAAERGRSDGLTREGSEERIIAIHTYAFALVSDGDTPGRAARAPLAPLLGAPASQLAIEAERDVDTLHITATSRPTNSSSSSSSSTTASEGAAAERAQASYSLSVVAHGRVAHYVELTLRDTHGRKLPFVSMSRNLVTMLPGESLSVHATVLWSWPDEEGARRAGRGDARSSRQTTTVQQDSDQAAKSAVTHRAWCCAEAWNAKRACVRLPRE